MDPLAVYRDLVGFMKKTGKAAVAYSGGADSTLVLKAAMEAFAGKTLAISLRLPYTPAGDMREGMQLAKEQGAPLLLIEMPIPEAITGNPPDRCYLCKKILFTRIIEAAKNHGFQRVFDGSNADDPFDHRPGLRALEELQVISPLRETGTGKEKVRQISRQLGLPTWDKPANACLLTRLPHNTVINEKDLIMIDRAEQFIREQGFGMVRVRMHGRQARIEVSPGQIEALSIPEMRRRMIRFLRELGFEQITIDPQGYRMGSLNLNQKIHE